jgi:hypothetical protein
MEIYILIFVIYYQAIVEILGCDFGEKMVVPLACEIRYFSN